MAPMHTGSGMHQCTNSQELLTLVGPSCIFKILKWLCMDEYVQILQPVSTFPGNVSTDTLGNELNLWPLSPVCMGGSPPSNIPRNQHFQNARDTGAAVSSGGCRAHFENVDF